MLPCGAGLQCKDETVVGCVAAVGKTVAAAAVAAEIPVEVTEVKVPVEVTEVKVVPVSFFPDHIHNARVSSE